MAGGLQHSPFSNSSSPGTLPAGAVTLQQPKAGSGGQHKAPQRTGHSLDVPGQTTAPGHALFREAGRLQAPGTAGAREALGAQRGTRASGAGTVLLPRALGQGTAGQRPPGHLHGDFALFIAEPCAKDKFLSTLQIPTSYFKRKNPAKLLTPESANLCLVLTFGCHFTLPNKFCPFPVLSHTTETPSAQPATKTNSSPPLNTVINSPCSKLIKKIK